MDPAAETAEFAALLGELKSRTGLSYGTLGKRLHMSPSTLHRYCKGEALPADYAPVERLARLCKASPEELTELHRRWIVAVAARDRDRRTARAAGADTPATPPAPVDTPATPVAPVARQEPRPEPQPPRAQDMRPARDTPPVPAAPPVPELPPVGERSPSPDGPVRSRRRAAGIAAAVAAAVTCAVLALSLLPDDGGNGGDAEGDTDGRALSNGSGDPAPFSVSVRPHVWADPCSPHYLVDAPPEDVELPPVEQDAPDWVNDMEAVAADQQLVELTVQGTGEETVVLQDLHVRVVESEAPPEWDVYGMGVGCGGGVPLSNYRVDLDAARPAAAPVDGQPGFPRQVSASEPEVFLVEAAAVSHAVSWYLELEWSSGDREGVLRIDDGDRPFRTSGVADGARWAWMPGSDVWSPEVLP